MTEIGNNLALILLALIVTAGIVGYRFARRPKTPTIPARIEAAQILAGLDELRTLLRTEAARNGFRDPADQPTTKHDFGSHV